MLFINCEKHRDIILSNDIKENNEYEFDKNTNTYYKNYRTAYCYNYGLDYEINWKITYYWFLVFP
jgi:hypothetical protein